jgi:hypothetical protein
MTGCVATAWGQLMRYWQWPQQGTGSYSYNWNGQILSVDFSAATYDWDNMPDVLNANSTSAQTNAVSLLLYHIGVAATMNYGCSSSGSNAWADQILDVYFGYKQTAQLHNRSDYSSSAAWFALFKNEFDANPPRPVIFSIFTADDESEGHEVVADGYQDDTISLIHINYGWDDSYDGFYNITRDFIGGDYLWDADVQVVVTGIEPDRSSSDTDTDSPDADSDPSVVESSDGSSGCFIMALIGW